MTKLHSSLFRAAALFAAISVLVSPSATLAAVRPEANLFCSNFETMAARVTAAVPKREEFRDQKLDARVTRVDGRLQFRLSTLDDKRGDWDTDRSGGYAKLEAAATTDAQRAAVQTYKSAIDAAVSVRRSSVDSAVTTFQEGVNGLLASRQSQMDGAFTSLTSATRSAIETARASCAAGEAGPTVRTAFVAALRTANASFRAAVQPTGIRAEVEKLRQTRDAAVRDAVSDFTAAVETANRTLRDAWKA